MSRRPGPGRAARLAAAATSVVAAFALAACTQIPTSGPVIDGEASPEPVSQLYYNPNPPRDDATPVQIVEGFQAALQGAPTGTFDVAKSFLTGDAESWSPYTSVYVTTGDAGLDVDETTLDSGRTTVTGKITVVGTIDSSGVYTEESPGSTLDLSYTLTQDDAGRWRISQLEDGLLIPTTDFDNSFQRSVLYFATSDRAQFVPDERWFPRNVTWSTSAVKALLAGPATWMQDSVLNVAPPGTTLVGSVPVDDGVAAVDLSSSVTDAAPEDRALLQAQIEATLVNSYPRTQEPIRSVALTSAGAALVIPDVGTPRFASTDATPVAVSDGALMSLDGSTLSAIEGAPPLAGFDPTGIAVDGDLVGEPADASVYLRDGTDRILRLAGDGRAELLRADDVATPSVDRFGWAWTGQGDGTVTVFGADGTARPVDVPWLAARSVTSIDVSAEGARAVVVSSGPGGVEVNVAGIVRDADDVPVALSEPVEIGPALVSAREARWAGDTDVAVLGEQPKDGDETVRVFPVGGPSVTLAVVAGSRSIAAANGLATLLVVDASGGLSGRSGSGTVWRPVADGVTIVTYQR
ncbi:sporulation and spore germination protein [Sediminihabitans luteus]|uniref:Sporulation and spore germination protein n=1 Tax=Sediminihabitans luteus TaxID=1138585 RepID=A0A2M9CDR5_9CELL|nr:LpqB family beta-propeller domain-containing protein [Sediminihabitans luteus]PJJ70019.1 sporulation and spore germination protein [Sediminihabitans luteus]GII99340.1 hypothetical protein Slu03_17180 [Sediminihabitans luteus]